MSLRHKIIRTLLVLVAIYAALDYSVQQLIVAPSFQELEREYATRDLNQTIAAIGNEVRHLDRQAAGLAEMPSLPAFITEGDQSFADVVLHEGALDVQRVDLLFVVEASGAVIWSDIRPEELGGEAQLPGFPRGALSQKHPLLANPDGSQSPLSGLMTTARGPMVVSSRPVMQPGRADPVGHLLLGSLLSGERMTEIASSTGMDIQVWTVDSPDLPDAVREIRDQVTSSATTLMRPIDDNRLEMLAGLDDILHRPTIILRAEEPRTISAGGDTAIEYALLSAVAIGLVTLLLLQFLLGRIVLEPLATLTRCAVEIGKNDDAHARVNMQRDDEFGTLAAEFDSMLGKLAKSREEVVIAARAAGMSEIATGILHNVGNVLNSVVLGVELADDRMRRSKLPQLLQLTELLAEQGDNLGRFIADDPRGKKLLPFLQALSKELQLESQDVSGEISNVREGVDHIRELVASQQAYAGQSRLDESLNLVDELEKAIELTAQATGTVGFEMRVEREFAEVPLVSLDRHKLLEILVNLIQNARQSVTEAAVENPCVTVILKHDDPQRVRVAVRDNGLGIAPDNLARIFSHGFTTKKNGHGFGLHSAANSATELGAKLSVHSEGLGQGAEFALEFPVNNARAAA